MKNDLMSLYNRTLKNCEFYEKENNTACLLSEIGCLRGIAYCMELSGADPVQLHGLQYFIEVSNNIKSAGMTMKKYRVKEECTDVFFGAADPEYIEECQQNGLPESDVLQLSSEWSNFWDCVEEI